MIPHTKGSHCPPEWSQTAGSWWSEPCFCKAVQSLNYNMVAASGSGTWLNQTANAPAGSSQNWTTTTIYPDNTIIWPTPQPIPIYPVWIHYDHHCSHEETVKVLTDLIKHLIEKLEKK